MFNSLRKMIDRFLKRLGEQNQLQFGNRRMDCCDMNKKPAPKK